MKAVILAGGFGTRISEESAIKPKPMIHVGPQPILWHIMKIYSYYGINDFIICCGYRGDLIKKYFAEYALSNSDVSFDLRTGEMVTHQNTAEPWKVTLVDTGANSMTGGRLKRVQSYVGDSTFCMTYGDGVCDVAIDKLIAFHQSEKRYATLTAVQPDGRFGAFSLRDGTHSVDHFKEKPKGDGAWINGGFFVLEPQVFDYIDGDHVVWEREPMMNLARDGQLSAYRHENFWQCMDTLRDKNVLEDHWNSGKAPWKKWS
ncbi:MAG: glucose-1-phosphate cytidylyltransferase [Verrucomicrobia bacterium]|nr:glucose-1-phosphate cytidylyltransferase [Verrucomicrobiota bacterium]